MNGPIQQRTNILNSDSSRASTLPDDYETDLESEWSNPSKTLHCSNENEIDFLQIYLLMMKMILPGKRLQKVEICIIKNGWPIKFETK